MTFAYRLGWLFFRAMFATYFRWRVFNPERVPLTGPVILAANHISYLDPPLVGSPLHRQINYLARASLFRFPIFGAIIRSWHAIPVDREGGSGKGLRVILDCLHGGAAIILFPEGTRSPDGQLRRAHSGIGLIVAKSDAPVVPARVFGSYEAWGRKQKIPLPKRVMVKYGQPMSFEKLRAEAKTCDKVRLKQIYQEMADEIMAAIAKLEPKSD